MYRCIYLSTSHARVHTCHTYLCLCTRITCARARRQMLAMFRYLRRQERAQAEGDNDDEDDGGDDDNDNGDGGSGGGDSTDENEDCMMQ